MSKKLEVYAGPCVIEDESLTLSIANTLREVLKPFEKDVDFYFKASFDKANRTSIHSFRGPGLEEGLRILEKAKNEFDLKLVTDFHHPDQANSLKDVVDVLQIPAFLCRQTDMIIEGAKSAKAKNRTLNIKKGQFLSPEETENIVTKAKNFLTNDKIRLTERGSSFGYNNLIVDMGSFMIMKSFGVKTLFDATHSLQRPGGNKTFTARKREQMMVLSKAAISAGADGLFFETHPDPQNAKSDPATCMDLKHVKKYLETIVPLYIINLNLLESLDE